MFSVLLPHVFQFPEQVNCSRRVLMVSSSLRPAFQLLS